MQRPSARPAPAKTVSLPVWAVALVPLLFVLVLVFALRQGADARAQLGGLEAQARKLSLELEAERSKNQAYSVEAVQLQQSLKVLESEINRLRSKAKLPPVKFVPAAPNSAPPKPEPGQPASAPGSPTQGSPRGAGERIEVGELLLSLNAQMNRSALELESTAEAVENPLGPDPKPRPRSVVRRVQAPQVKLSELAPVADPGGSVSTGVPLAVGTRVTSTFGYRSNPFGGANYEFHNGVDFAAEAGTPVYATAAGRVIEKGWNPIFGLMVLLDHKNGYYTLYGHLSRIDVEKDQDVPQSAPLGTVGSTGRSTGPHLHYTVYRYGSAVDPLPFVGAR